MMFNSILIAECFESSNISVQKTVSELSIPHIDHVTYCDDALSKIQKALTKGKSYDLLITDLNFEDNHYIQQLRSGEELIEVVKEVQPDIKILVLSNTNKKCIVDKLFKKYGIDAYVCRSSSDDKDLKRAISSLCKTGKQPQIEITERVKNHNNYQFSDYDIQLTSLLAQGLLVKHIPFYLEKNNIKPSGLSSVEKRISHLRGALEVTSNEQLIVYCKNYGLI